MDNLQSPDATSPLAAWLYYLENLHPQAVELGLNRIRLVAKPLQLQTPAPTVFTVAGTNGKGTTCRLLETLLMAAGYRTGVYSSPHLIRYTERVRILGEELPETAHTASFAAIESARGTTSLTYFEYGTLSALQLFKQAALDVVILEVGVGGRLDATNIVDANVAVVTSIALDHTEWLGPDVASIGREKAGVFRAGKPAVVGEAEMPSSVADVAAECGAVLLQRGRDWCFYREGETWTFRDRDGQLENLPLPQVPLSNAATALAALRASRLPLDQAVIYSGLNKACLPGRFQIINSEPCVILDVAHNPHAAGWLASRLAGLLIRGEVHAVIGMLYDKDIAGTLACLLPQVDHWYCASLDVPRGATATQLMAHLPAAHPFSRVKDAWKMAYHCAQKQDIVLVCGSFYTVSQVMEVMETEK